MKRIVGEVERRLAVVTAVEQSITAYLFSERLGQDRNGRGFTDQHVPQEEVASHAS